MPEQVGSIVGVDSGVKALAPRSAGRVVPHSRPRNRRLKQRTRFPRASARNVNRARTRGKAVKRLARRSGHVRNQRQNPWQHRTTSLAKTTSVVVVVMVSEDLPVAGVHTNHHLAQAIGDVGFYEFRRHLTDNAAWYGCQVLVASRWEPSSKTCSHCGWVDEQLTLADRTFRCEQCGLVIDRDLNAASNLAKLAGRSSDRHNAGGAGSAGVGLTAHAKLPALKQEPDAV